MVLRNYSRLPPIVSDYPLDDRISVLVPCQRTNEILNPSLETNLTGYTAGAGSLARTTTQQYHGAYSAIYTPSAAVNDGFYYTITTTNATRAISCKFLGVAGLSYTFSIASTAPADLQAHTFTASGRWQWIWFYFTESGATTRRIYWKKNNHASVAPFFVDGVQSEIILAGESVSSYLDGDQIGLVPNQIPTPYYWTGTPHASTSVRSGLTRAGGMVVRFSSFGFFLTALIGLGLATPQNVSVEYARIDGGYDDYTRKPSRQFTVQGVFESRGDYLSLRQQRGGLARLLDRDLVAQDQRLILLRDVEDECGQLSATTCRLLGKYQGGLDGNTDNHLASQAPITFTSYLPVVVADGESGSGLATQTSVGTVNRIAQRSPAGVWSTLGTGLNNSCFALARGLNGRLYAGGSFTTAGGNTVKKVAEWDGTQWNVIDAGVTTLTGPVRAITVGPDGKIYFGATGITIGGVTGSVASYDPATTTWALVGGANNTDLIYDLVIDSSGNLYSSGQNSAGTNNSVQKWNGSAWSSLSLTDGAGSIVYALGIARDGTTLYAGGNFASIGSNAIVRLAKYSGSGTTWTAVGSPVAAPNNDVTAIVFGPDNRMYVGGAFTGIGGLSITGIAVFNGVSWSALGAGVNNNANDIALAPDGTIYARGLFTNANNFVTPGGVARFNGATWVSIDAALPVNAGVFGALLVDADGTLTVGLDATGSATAAGSTTVTNQGTARSYPTMTLTGPTSGSSRIYSISNPVTGRSLYMSYTMLPSEVATLIFTPDNLSFTSTFQGNIANTILPGSNTADFFLTPGSNTILLYAASSTVTASLYYRPAYLSLDDVP